MQYPGSPIISSRVGRRSRLTHPHRYNLFGSLCSAVGGLVCGSALSYLIEGSPGLSPLVAYRCAMVAYSVVNGAMLCLFACLSEAVEAPSARAKDLPVAQFLGLHRCAPRPRPRAPPRLSVRTATYVERCSSPS